MERLVEVCWAAVDVVAPGALQVAVPFNNVFGLLVPGEDQHGLVAGVGENDFAGDHVGQNEVKVTSRGEERLGEPFLESPELHWPVEGERRKEGNVGAWHVLPLPYDLDGPAWDSVQLYHVVELEALQLGAYDVSQELILKGGAPITIRLQST